MIIKRKTFLIAAIAIITLGPSLLLADYDGAGSIFLPNLIQENYNEDAISSLLLDSASSPLRASAPTLGLGAYDPVECRNQLIPFVYNRSAVPFPYSPFRAWPLRVRTGETFQLSFMLNSSANCMMAFMSFSSANPKVLDVRFTDITAPFTRMQKGVFVNLTIEGKVIGFSAIKVTVRDPVTPGNKTIYSDCEGKLLPTCRFIAVAFFTKTLGDQVYDIINIVFIVTAQLNIGLRITWTHVKTIFKKPLPCIVGLCCHFILMPLIAFAMSRIIDVGSPELALGYFIAGIIAGGGLSNLHTRVLGGDFPLAAVMTYITQILSVPLTPMWLAIFAPLIIPDSVDVNLPYDQIAQVIAEMLPPAIVAFLFRFFFPKWGFFLQKFVTLPFLALLFLYYCTYGLYKNAFMFELFTPAVILCGCLMPYFGFILSGIIGFAFRFPLPTVLSIMMETSFQNTIIALYIIQATFTANPIMAVLTVVGPYSVLIFCQVPLVAIEIVLIFKRRCWPRLQKRLGRNRHQQLEEDDENVLQESGDIGDEMSESTRAMGSQFEGVSETASTEEETKRFFERKAEYFGKELTRG